jgi:NAD(P)-dependent dehydrogenase (short-subunit alcohol dehydrogenase family)
VGQGIARALAGAGAKLIIAQRSKEQGEAEATYLRDTHGVEALFVATDVTKAAEVEAMVKAGVDRFGRLDILVNNAGGIIVKRLENYSDDEMAYAFDLNYWSAFWAMRAAFPVMRAHGYGRIINLGSLGGVNAHMFTVGYNASKEAIRALSRTAAVEWGGHGITVNVICPTAATPTSKEIYAANPDMLTNILKLVPAGRIGDTEQDIGPVALFLASEGSGYMNGNTLFVDGGAHVNGVAWRPPWRIDEPGRLEGNRAVLIVGTEPNDIQVQHPVGPVTQV